MLELVTDATVELLTTAEAKAWLKVSNSAEDTLIDVLVKSARLMAENYTGRRFINQTWRLWLDGIPRQSGKSDRDWWDGTRQGHLAQIFGQERRDIDLKLAPVSSITTFNYFTQGAVETVFPSSLYVLDSVSSPARVFLNESEVWPTDLRSRQAIKIQFVAGYGAAAANVPADAITAVKLILAHLYEHRGDAEIHAEVPSSAKVFLDRFVIRRMG